MVDKSIELMSHYILVGILLGGTILGGTIIVLLGGWGLLEVMGAPRYISNDIAAKLIYGGFSFLGVIVATRGWWFKELTHHYNDAVRMHKEARARLAAK